MDGFNKDKFIEAIKLANNELIDYINLHLQDTDLTYTNVTGYGGDNSLKIDIIAENIFIRYLSEFGDIFSEECGLLSNNSDFQIIIDPIDGSSNFMHNLPYYGSSIALKYNNEVLAGFVTNLVSNILTYRIFDSEIFYYDLKNEKYIKKNIQKISKLAIFEKSYDNPELCKKLSLNKIKYRSPGAMALSLCDARNYKFSMFCGEIRSFDVDAALYINKDLFLYKKDDILILSLNKNDFDVVLEIIKDI